MPDVNIDGYSLLLALAAYVELRLAVGRLAGAVHRLERSKLDKPKGFQEVSHV